MTGFQKHIYPHQYRLEPTDREENIGQKALLIWFTGLSGSGKSTLANALEIELFNRGYKTFVLDGDNVRTGINHNLGFSKEDREENIRRVAEVANLMMDAGLIVLASFISPFAQDRQQVKNTVGENRYFEVYVNTKLEICEQRDPKGLYRKARNGKIPHFTGISSPYEPPENPNMCVDTGALDSRLGAELIYKSIESMISK